MERSINTKHVLWERNMHNNMELIMLKSSALVTQLDTIKVVISLVAQKEWTIYQLDVKSAFLPEGLSEEVYVEPPSK